MILARESLAKLAENGRTLLICLLLGTLYSSSPLYGQYNQSQLPFSSSRTTSTAYTSNPSGLFFPLKEPEEPEISLGPVVVRPGLAVKETYSSNLTLAGKNPKEDYFTDLYPALLFQLPYGRHNFQIEYLGNATWYTNNPRWDAIDHSFAGRAMLIFFKDLRVGLDHTTALAHTPVEDIGSAEGLSPDQSSFFKRTRKYTFHRTYFSLQSGPTLFKNLTFSFNDENRIVRFQEKIDEIDNYISNQPQITLRYLILPTLHGVLGYNFTYLDGQEVAQIASIDNRQHQLVYGIDWDYPPNLRFAIHFTYNWLDYVKANLSANYWGAQIGLTYNPRERLNFSFSFSRSTSPAFAFTGERPNNEGLPELGGVFFFQNQATFSVGYQFRHNLVISANLTYRGLLYEANPTTGEKRTDDMLGGALHFLYKMRPWLFLHMIGGYSNDGSNIGGQGYEEKRLEFFIQTAF